MKRSTPVAWRWLGIGCSLIAGCGPAALAAADAPAPGPAKEALAVDGLAVLRGWVPPVYPRDELKARHSGMVTVRLVVDASGKVTQARALEDSDEKFIEPAVAAVKAWSFAPALERGQPVACCLDTLVAFSPAVGQAKSSAVPPGDQKFSPAPRTAPTVRVSPDGEYPAVLVERKIRGRVGFACTVTTDGRATGARVTVATHPDFVLPALHGLSTWEFQPAMQGDLPVAGPAEGLVTFDNLGARAEETLAANGVTATDGTPPAVAPMPVFVADPVWPLERRLKGEGGTATVDFTVTETGAVIDVKVREASAPEFGAALRAAVEMWAFERPVENNHVVSVALAKRVEFKADASGAEPVDPLAELAARLGRGEIGGAKGLDEKLAPLFRVAPPYPAALKGAGAGKGAAEIECVIDREGRVRLPRVASATREEFGWAAATAASLWVFRAPQRGGEPTEVKVRIPFQFAAPEE